MSTVNAVDLNLLSINNACVSIQASVLHVSQPVEAYLFPLSHATAINNHDEVIFVLGRSDWLLCYPIPW